MASFDIFEVLRDGSCIWRTCVSGRYEKERKLQELAETSNNKFYALDLAAGDTLPPGIIESFSHPPPQSGQKKNAA
jgi:hypothetical protein